MAPAWLTRKRKGELLDLAHQVEVPGADSLLKDDLVVALESQLDQNERKYAKLPLFADYYNGRSSSPIKRERFSPEVLTATRPRRRQTLVKQDSDDPTPTRTALVNRTPRTITRVAQRVSDVASPSRLAQVHPSPASPSLMDQSFHSVQDVKEKAAELWGRSRIDEWKEWIRQNASSVSAIQALILFIEAAGLQYNTLDTTHQFVAPSFGTSLDARIMRFPSPAKLISSDFWAPVTLWSLTSWALPLVFSYFFNLTLKANPQNKSSNRQYPIDPLTFNIVKAILTYSAYNIVTQADAALTGKPNAMQAQNLGWGPFSEPTVSTIRNNVPGGYYGLQIGAVVGVLFSLYDAALKK
ncbi:hypothetical protein P280DRAFT_484551 [Massarina eburnea CBS 473.64]|uniref:Uncharacterized protein n=1 Tax=Massarina eburnea CBS 473.64 TaxID=1395130 RepID=A0A6A6RMX0_9PLEO|nr:hypothetical protein P280DRAFT_484551 [Massarina eburnea CBS 473.64]